MAYQVPTSLPATLVVGATWTWSRRFADFSAAEGWALVAQAVGPTTRLAVTGTASGVDWAFNAPAADTASQTPGLYRVTIVGTNGAEVRVIESGDTRITADPINATPGDGLTFDEKMVRAIEAELERRLTNQAVASYSIAGRSLTYEPLAELRRQLAQHRSAVRRVSGVQQPAMLVTFGPGR
jgi:hypothetical protein